MRAKNLLVAALVFAASASHAQDAMQTVEAKDITADGKLIGCSLEFTMGFRDHVYRQGAYSGATGSINLWGNKGFYGSFKLVGADIDTGQPIAFKVASASLFGSSGARPHQGTRVECEDVRHYCSALEADAFLDVLAGASATGSIRMSFNRKNGGMDVPLKLVVAPRVVLDALHCAENLGR